MHACGNVHGTRDGTVICFVFARSCATDSNLHAGRQCCTTVSLNGVQYTSNNEWLPSRAACTYRLHAFQELQRHVQCPYALIVRFTMPQLAVQRGQNDMCRDVQILE